MRTPLAVAAGLLLLTAAACARPTSSPATTAGPTTAAPTGGEATEPSADTATVEHAMGATEVACTPQRVVTLGQGQTDTTLALGVEPVGVVQPWTAEFYDYLPEAVHDADVVGTELEPSLERIAALDPDVILGSKLRHEAIYEQLSAIAPTVVAETIGRTWKDNVSLWAQALCRQDAGDHLLAQWRQRTASFRQGLAELGGASVSLVRFMPAEVRIYLTGFPGSVLRDAGLERPPAQQVDDWEASQQLITVSQERIPQMDADVMFTMTSPWAGEGDVDQLEDEYTSHPLWHKLDAVHSDAVFPVDEGHWNLGGGILAANAMMDDLEQHFLEPGGARAALTDGDA
jgi:iron complex transport system substrate-binding protein